MGAGNDANQIICRNNLFNSNAADVSNFPAVSAGDGVGDQGDLADAPGFNDEANDDYYLGSGSAAISQSWDIKWVQEFWTDVLAGTNPPTIAAEGYSDIGAAQREPPAGGGSTNYYPVLQGKTGGKQ